MYVCDWVRCTIQPGHNFKPDCYTDIVTVHFNIPKKWKSIDIYFITSLTDHQGGKIFLCELIMITVQVCCIWKFYRTYYLFSGILGLSDISWSTSWSVSESLACIKICMKAFFILLLQFLQSLSLLATHLKIEKKNQIKIGISEKNLKFWFGIIRQFDNESGVTNWRTWRSGWDADLNKWPILEVRTILLISI